MGIPSYFSYIVKNHIKIIKKFNRTEYKINNLYLDCNSIIYDCVNTMALNIDNDIINNVILKINFYINLIEPTDNIYIAFDGVSPIAKLDQQRQRRYKSY